MATQEELIRIARQIADSVKSQLPNGTGAIVLCFDYGEKGNMAYMSTANREDCAELLKEFYGLLSADLVRSRARPRTKRSN